MTNLDSSAAPSNPGDSHGARPRTSRGRAEHALAIAVMFALAGHLGCRDRPKHPGAWQGIVEFEERELAFELGGRVAQVMVDEGDRVTRDRVLARLNDELEHLAEASRINEAEAANARVDLLRAGARDEEVRMARARLRAARAQEDFLESNLDRHRRLTGSSAATPEAQVEELESRYLMAVAERQALEMQLRILRAGPRDEEIADAEARARAATSAAELESARVYRHELLAPDDGVVLEVAVEPGEIVAPGTPVITMADTRHPYVDVFVPQGQLGGIRQGMLARVYVDSLAEPLSGRVEYIARAAEFTPRFLFSEQERPNLVVRVRVRIDDPDERLHAGVPAFVYLESQGDEPSPLASPAKSASVGKERSGGASRSGP